MPDEPRGSEPSYEPLPGWPARPDPPPEAASPPSSPPPGWPAPPPSGWSAPPPPWAAPPGGPRSAEPLGPRAPASPAGAPPAVGGVDRTAGGRAGFRGSRRLALAGGLVVVLLIAAVAVAISRGDDGSSGAEGGRPGSLTAPQPAAGNDIPVLDGRLVVVARPGWELRDQTADAATVKLELRDPTGRELLSTLVLAALPGGGSLEPTLTLDGGSRFEVKTAAGPLQAAAVPGPSARVVAAMPRPPSTFFLSLSVFALDGSVIEVPLLQKLFVEQVVPQLRFK